MRLIDELRRPTPFDVGRLIFVGAVFMSQVPLFGVIWSGLYFADAIKLQTMIALALILLGIAVTRKGS